MFVLDYDYSCRYDKKLKRRGRIPSALNAARAPVAELGKPPLVAVNHSIEQCYSPTTSRNLLRSEGGTDSRSPECLVTRFEDDRGQATQPLTPAPENYSSGIANARRRHTRDTLNIRFPASDNQASRKLNPQYHLAGDKIDQQRGSGLTPSSSRSTESTDGEYVRPFIATYNTHGSGRNGSFVMSRKVGDIVAADAVRDGRSDFAQFPPLIESSPTASTGPSILNTRWSVAEPAVSEPLATGCRYKCLYSILPHLRGIISPSAACELLDIYFTAPCSSFFHCASPYVLTHVLRKKSVLHATSPRQTSPALLSTMLWCAGQTAETAIFSKVPGARRKICDRLYALSTTLVAHSDRDSWYRTSSTWQQKKFVSKRRHVC